MIVQCALHTIYWVSKFLFDLIHKFLGFCYFASFEKKFVLKSADLGTLFSSRYSENSSHAHTRRHPHTFTHTCAHTCAHLCTPAYTHIPAHTGSSSSRWVWTDQSYVIRLNIKKAEEEERKKDRRKKEGTRVRWKHQRTKKQKRSMLWLEKN